MKPHHAIKLLYVEDDQDFRELVAERFVRAGFDVTAVEDAQRALEELGGGQYDVVVTDYNLPVENGAWLLSNAASQGLLERTAAVVLTSEKHPAGVERYRVLDKLIAIGTLLTNIAAALGERPAEARVRCGPTPVAELEIVLYVTATSQESHSALRNLRRALSRYDAALYRLTIVDVASAIDEEHCEQLEEDGVIVTPTLVVHKPGPKTWIVGSLAPIDAVETLLTSVLGRGRDVVGTGPV